MARELAERTNIRPTDVHDVVLGCPADEGGAGSGLLRRVGTARLFGSGMACYLVDRGTASGLQALGLAAQGVLSGQQDVVLAIGAQPVPPGMDGLDGAGESLPGNAVGGALIAGDRFTRRYRTPPTARVRRFTTASAYGTSVVDGMVESAVRMLMNETLNVDDVDVWEIYDGHAEHASDAAARLGLEAEQVNAVGGASKLGDIGAVAAFRSVVSGLDLLTRRDLSTCAILAPGPGATGVAMLIERM